jgi:hypothetical protein
VIIATMAAARLPQPCEAKTAVIIRPRIRFEANSEVWVSRSHAIQGPRADIPQGIGGDYPLSAVITSEL